MSRHDTRLPGRPPLDAQWLRSWLQPQHLAPEMLEVYRGLIAAHPARLLIVKSCLDDRVADQVGRCLRSETEYRTVYGLRSRGPNDEVTEDEWTGAPAADRLYRFSVSAGVRPQHRLSPNVLMLLKLRRALEDARFVGFFEEATACALVGSTFDAHIMRAGDFLAPHTDAFEGRRLACVIFLSADWRPRFGGALHVVTADGRDWAIDAEFNSMAVFDVSADTEHFVDPITAEGVARVTIGGWILEPAAT